MTSTATGGLVIDMAGLRARRGVHLGCTDWVQITQEQVSAFADLTGDHNFIHVDPERAAASPFGGTIAHGFLTLSLVAPITQRLEVSDAAVSVNYGLEKVRFPAPLPVGAHWRAAADVVEVTDIEGGVQARIKAAVEVKDSERPAVVAECVIRYYA
jgi:acyl dehydratase